MEIWSSIILGFVQGITEFLPISSSGHLILVRDLFGMDLSGSLAYDAVLHLATALAVLIYFRRDIWRAITGRDNILLGALALGTVPAVVIGFLFESYIETHLRSSSVVVTTLIGGAILFILAERLSEYKNELTIKNGWWIGAYQALALIPGVSRSGAAISGGMLFGLSRERATRFAFLLGLPVLFGIGLVKLYEIGNVGFESGVELALSAIIAFAVGLGAIHWMLLFLKNHTLYLFAMYRIVLAALFLFLL